MFAVDDGMAAGGRLWEGRHSSTSVGRPWLVTAELPSARFALEAERARQLGPLFAMPSSVVQDWAIGAGECCRGRRGERCADDTKVDWYSLGSYRA